MESTVTVTVRIATVTVRIALPSISFWNGIWKRKAIEFYLELQWIHWNIVLHELSDFLVL